MLTRIVYGKCIYFLSFEYATTIAGHISPRQRDTCIVVLRQKDSRRSQGSSDATRTCKPHAAPWSVAPGGIIFPRLRATSLDPALLLYHRGKTDFQLKTSAQQLTLVYTFFDRKAYRNNNKVQIKEGRRMERLQNIPKNLRDRRLLSLREKKVPADSR